MLRRSVSVEILACGFAPKSNDSSMNDRQKDTRYLRPVDEAVVSDVEERVIKEACEYASKKRAEGCAPEPVLVTVLENCKTKVPSASSLLNLVASAPSPP